MPTKRKAGEGVTLTPEKYQHAKDVMQELAFRGPKEEALVMRIAKACDFTEVMTQIKKLRIYAKKQGLVRAPKGKGDGSAPKKRKKKGQAGNGGEVEGAVT